MNEDILREILVQLTRIADSLENKKCNKKKTTEIATVKNDFEDECQEVVMYLNEVLGTRYKASATKTRQEICGRLKEGYTVEDFKKVIDKKYDEWGNDKKMSKYLTPNTLFCKTHFDTYLNQLEVKRTKTLFDTLANL